MKDFIAVSRCLSCKEQKAGGGYWGEFHFRGVLWGLDFNELSVFAEEEFEVGRDYLLHLNLLDGVQGEALHTELLKKKLLDEVEGEPT